MIIPKSKCRILQKVIDRYLKNHCLITPENKEILAVVSDKLSLVISGDATGLMIDQVYDPRITGKKLYMSSVEKKPCDYCRTVHDPRVGCPEYVRSIARRKKL